MRRVLVAFDKFKGAMTAQRACEVAARVVGDKLPGTQVVQLPLTDGGEGFAQTLLEAAVRRGGSALVQRRSHVVTGPRGVPETARWGIVDGTLVPPAVRQLLGVTAQRVAVIEMASASGLQLVPPAWRDPLSSSSVGTGQLLLAAAGAADLVLLGVGGSATVDLGLGALQALGARCVTAAGVADSAVVPAGWSLVVGLDSSRLVALPPLFVALDVSNPLLGARGAAATFAPQKGLPTAELDRLELASERMARLLLDHFGVPAEVAAAAGMGAGGGMAFGLTVAYGAQNVGGSDLVGAWLELDSAIALADLVVTGEGRFDASSLNGKIPGHVVQKCRVLGKRCLVLAGSVDVSLPGPEPMGALIEAVAISPAGLEPSLALAESEGRLAAALSRWIDAAG